jgi:hypothetical protein
MLKLEAKSQAFDTSQPEWNPKQAVEDPNCEELIAHEDLHVEETNINQK